MTKPIDSTNVGNSSEEELLTQLLLRMKAEKDFDPQSLIQIFLDIAESGERQSTPESQTAAKLARKMIEILKTKFVLPSANGKRA